MADAEKPAIKPSKSMEAAGLSSTPDSESGKKKQRKKSKQAAGDGNKTETQGKKDAMEGQKKQEVKSQNKPEVKGQNKPEVTGQKKAVGEKVDGVKTEGQDGAPKSKAELRAERRAKQARIFNGFLKN